MIAGRKLLLADDSVAIQKVIDLTFTDEGMEVTTVGDGQDALEKLNQFTPDVVLADIYMPGVDGYQLCKLIKQNKRCRSVPVMLLVGSFEPFDEGEAKRAGADDVVTKPFQSIRDLVSRVGSLVGRKEAGGSGSADGLSVLGLDYMQEDVPSTAEDLPAVNTTPIDEMATSETNVRVLVEAPTIEPEAARVFVEAPAMEVESVEQENVCPPIIDLQTADTKRLKPLPDSATTASEMVEFDETVELHVVDEGMTAEPSEGHPAITLPSPAAVQTVDAAGFGDDGVLDLGDVDSFTSGGEEFVLDVDVEPVATSTPSALGNQPSVVSEVSAGNAAMPEASPGLVTGANQTNPEPFGEPRSAESESAPLSPDAIDAISRRVVEQLSDKVVREIAWEVVPELSELLIKRRLEEKR